MRLYDIFWICEGYDRFGATEVIVFFSGLIHETGQNHCSSGEQHDSMPDLLIKWEALSIKFLLYGK